MTEATGSLGRCARQPRLTFRYRYHSMPITNQRTQSTQRSIMSESSPSSSLFPSALFRRVNDNDSDNDDEISKSHDNENPKKKRGRHLAATSWIEKGRLVWAERPLVALQSLDNRRDAWIRRICSMANKQTNKKWQQTKHFYNVPIA